MHKGRLEAFSDGVIAILITIMVLELKVPHGIELADLKPLVPVFIGYILSFIYLAIYWNNHHHMLQATSKVDGRVLWANSHLLFWLSLIPFTTGWMGEHNLAPWPVFSYGFVLFMSGVAYNLLERQLIRLHGKGSVLDSALGTDIKGWVSVAMYAVAMGLAFVNSWISYGLYVASAILWMIPDRRIERLLTKH